MPELAVGTSICASRRGMVQNISGKKCIVGNDGGCPEYEQTCISRARRAFEVVQSEGWIDCNCKFERRSRCNWG